MDSEPNSVLVSSSDEGITIITINRPHRRNAVDAHTGQKLYDAFVAFENDPSQKICVFHGSEGAFCAGADLHMVATAPRQSSAAPSGGLDHAPVQHRNRGPMGPSRLQLQKPVICAVAGHAVAGGLELSLLGDVRIAEEDAVFGVFCRRWGIPLIDGGTVRLPAVVGLGRALDMILTGRPVGAREALAFGLANRVVPKGKALEEALAMARRLLQFPQLCMNVDRASCYNATFDASSFEEALRFEYDEGVRVVSLEGIKGAARFSAGLGRHGSYEEHPKSKL